MDKLFKNETQKILINSLKIKINFTRRKLFHGLNALHSEKILRSFHFFLY